MKMSSLILSCFVGVALTTTLTTTSLALTVEIEVTLAYVRDHPKEFSVKVTKGEDGLIHFTIRHDVDQPMYHVAHLAVYHQGKLIATSDTPLFGKKEDNTFYFSISAEDLALSKFSLSDFYLGGATLPAPGATVHQFRLLDFVPEQMLK